MDKEQGKTQFRGPGEWRSQAAKLERAEEMPETDVEEDESLIE